MGFFSSPYKEKHVHGMTKILNDCCAYKMDCVCSLKAVRTSCKSVAQVSQHVDINNVVFFRLLYSRLGRSGILKL